jgi:hypothetical protein
MQVIRDSVTYTEHAEPKTVTALDVFYALTRSGHTLYDDNAFPQHTLPFLRRSLLFCAFLFLPITSTNPAHFPAI